MTKWFPGIVAAARRALEAPDIRGLDIDSAEVSSRRKALIFSKHFLRSIYGEWYSQIARAHGPAAGRMLEIGAGGGFMREVIPETLSSDLLQVDGIEVVLDACLLPFRKGSLGGVSMTNVFHHLPDVEAFLGEVSRCVQAGGRVVMIEPWSTPWSRWIYKSFHHERFDPNAATWQGLRGKPLSEANGALPWIVFERDARRFAHAFASFEVVEIRPMMPILYLLSGGVSMRALSPDWSFPFWRFIDSWLVRVLPASAMFASIVLERRPD